MVSILFVKSSPSGAASVSGRLGGALIERLQQAHPAADLVVRDLAADPPPHLDAHYVAGRYIPPEQCTAEQAVAPCDRSIAELKAADIIVIASVTVNFSISAQVKPGSTRSFAPTRPLPLKASGRSDRSPARDAMSSKRAVVSTTSRP